MIDKGALDSSHADTTLSGDTIQSVTPDESSQVKRDRPLNNALYVTVASFVGKLFSYVLFLYSTRILGTQGFGLYNAILVFVGLFGLLTDLGLSTLVVRDLAQDRTNAVRYISNVMGVRAFGGLVAFALIVVLSFTPVMPAPLDSIRPLVYIYGAALIPISVGNTLSTIFQYSERLIYTAAFNIGESGSLALLSIAALRLGWGIAGMVIIFTAVHTISPLTGLVLVYRRRFLPRRFEVDLRWWPELIRHALPFMVLALLNVLYAQADTLLLAYLKGSTAVGLYRAAYRYLDIIGGMVGANLAAATLPAFSRVTAESRQSLASLITLTCRFMILISLPVALWGTFYGPQIMALSGRDFSSASGIALTILLWAFPLFLLETPLYQALYAVHRQRDVSRFFAITLVFNIVANLLAIPSYSFLGSAVITVASEVLNLLLTLLAVHRYVTVLPYRGIVLKPIECGVGVAAVLMGLSYLHVSMWIGIPVSSFCYVVLLRLLQVFGPEEQAIIKRLPFGPYLVRFMGLAAQD